MEVFEDEDLLRLSNADVLREEIADLNARWRQARERRARLEQEIPRAERKVPSRASYAGRKEAIS